MKATWRVTAAPRTADEGHAAAALVATRLGLPQVRRGNRSLGSMTRQHGPGGWLIVHPRHGLHAMTPEGTVWRWHPGLARTRVAACPAGHPDPLLQALGIATKTALKPRETGLSATPDLPQSTSGPLRLLDVNLGQGHDALVAAAAEVAVTGVEIDPIVHALTTDGLQRCTHPVLRDGATRITTQCADQSTLLASLPDDSFDAVLFSPMYVRPTFRAEDLVQLREVATQGWPSAATFAHALRVAPRVIVKVEPNRHPPLPPVSLWLGGKRRVAWAVLMREEPVGEPSIA